MNFLDHPRVKAYLRSVCRKIKSASIQREIREEMLSHIQEAVHAKMENGHALNDAVEAALAEFGTAEVLAIQFREAHRPVYLQWPFLSTVGFCLFILAALAAMDFSRRSSERLSAEINSIIERYRDRFLADEAILSAEPFFDFPGKERDAGAVLNGVVAWEDSQGLLDPFLRYPNGVPSNSLPKEIKDQLDHWTSHWIDHSADIEWKQVDFGWMDGLEKFDHWDLFKTGPLRDYLTSPGPKLNLWGIPIPNYVVFLDWAKLRLLRGIVDRELLAALVESRQLARLVYSSQILVAELVAANLLHLERVAYEYGAAHHLVKAAQWRPLSEEMVIRARRATYGFSQLFSPWVDAEFMEKVFDGKTAKAGMCAAIWEQLPAAAITRAYFRRQSPFEMDYEAKIKLMDQIIRQNLIHCRWSGSDLAIRVWNDPNSTKVFNLFFNRDTFTYESLWDILKYGYLSRVPIFGRVITAEIMRIVPRYMENAYEREHNRLPAEEGSSKPPSSSK